MFLVELVLQGVRGIRELQRLRFQTGFNLVAAGNEKGKTSSMDASLRLLFPADQGGDMASLVSREVPDASRAALVFLADDGAYYRVIEDFSRRGVNLSKYNAATKDFALLHKDWGQAAQFMAGQTSGVGEPDFSRVFLFRREQYSCTPGAPLPEAPVFAQTPSPRRPAGPTPQQEARLAELRDMLQKAEGAGDAAYRLDSAKIRLGETAKTLEALEEINGRIADLRVNLDPLAGCRHLPEDLADLITEHEQNQRQKMMKSDDLQQDIEGLKLQLQSLPKASFITDALSVAGAVVGVASLGVGLSGVLSAEQADYFLIGIIAAIGLVAAGWYRSSRKNSQHKTVQREVEDLVAELAEVERSFEDGGQAIMMCMKATGSTTAEELREKADNYRYFRAQLDEIEEERGRLLGGKTPEALYAAYQQEQQEVIECEKAARALAEYAVDTYSLRQEIERIESETAGASSWDGGTFGGGYPGAADEAPAPAPAVSGPVFQAELDAASRATGIEMETLVPAVEAAAQRNFQTVTGGRYVKVDAGHGTDPVVHGSDHSALSYGQLSHSTRELLYFCLRAGLVEALAGKLKLPFLLDDVLAGFDPNRQRAACQVLRTLGTKTQVILFTSNPSVRAEGDAVAELS